MKVIDRILIACYAVMGALALLVSGVCVVAPEVAGNLGLAVQAVLTNSIMLQILSVLLVIVMLAWSVRLVMLAVQREGSAPSSSASVQESANGAVRVSVRAMETLVRRAVEQTDGVLESKIRINNHDDSVSVEIDMVAGIESHVPAVTAILQRNVKGIVEEFSGIAVREVVVLVTDIRDNAPPALPAPKDESAQTVVVVPEAVEVSHAEEPAGDTAAEEAPVSGEAEVSEEEPASEEAESPAEESSEENAEPVIEITFDEPEEAESEESGKPAEEEA